MSEKRVKDGAKRILARQESAEHQPASVLGGMLLEGGHDPP